MFLLPDLKPEEILIYLRKSRTDDPALTVSETVAKHEQMLDEWSSRNLGALIPEQNRFREVVSGETIAARPEVQKVLRLIEQPKFKAVLIVEPQRLSRGDLEDIGYLSKILRFSHTIVITLQYTYDLSDERDRDYFERELMRGNDYLEYSKRIMHNGRKVSVESGYYIGSVAPFGYKKVHIKIGKKSIPTLKILPDEADAVRMIFTMYADGKGASAIIRALSISGVRPKFAAEWNETAIFKILDNPHYIGMILYNSRNQKTTVSDGEIVKTRKKSKTPDIYKGIHEPIIDMELWQRVREQRKYRHVPAVHSNQVLSYPLAGLVYCECGSIMIQASKVHGRKRRIYCKHQSTCGNVSVILSDVIESVKDGLVEALKAENITVSGTAKPQDFRSDMLRNRISALIRKQDALWEQLAEGMPHDTFDRLIERVSADLESANTALSEAIAEEDAAKSAENMQYSLSEAIAAIDNPDISAGEKNKMLKACIRRITYHRRKGENFSINIELKF